MLVFATNIWNHYTTTIGDRLAEILGDENFRMLLTSPVLDEPRFAEKIKMGWKFELPIRDWLVPNPQHARDFANTKHASILENADVAVIDSLYHEYHLSHAVNKRILAGRLTLFANERFQMFKEYPSFWDSLNIKNLWRWWYYHRRFSHNNVHYLPMNHFAVDDMRFFDAAHGRMWKWGYFPVVSEFPTKKIEDGLLRIGWCGRMIPWKHADYIIRAVALLPESYKNKCRVTIVGDGPCRDELVEYAKRQCVDGIIEFKHFMPVNEVARIMSELDVYLFPSDRHEGWGVALAEAMDKCCVPISCVEAGATLELIDEGENGFVFEKGDCDRIAKKIIWLMDHRQAMREMGLNAWRTMQHRSPDIAAERLVQLVRALQSGNVGMIPREGVCSSAERK